MAVTEYLCPSGFTVLVVPCDDGHHKPTYFHLQECCKYTYAIRYADNLLKVGRHFDWMFVGDDDFYIRRAALLPMLRQFNPMDKISLSLAGTPDNPKGPVRFNQFANECNDEVPQQFAAQYLSQGLVNELSGSSDEFVMMCDNIPNAAYDTAAGLWHWMHNAAFIHAGPCSLGELQAHVATLSLYNLLGHLCCEASSS